MLWSMKIADLPAFLMLRTKSSVFLRLGERKAHRRLVEDHQLGLEIERAGDRDALLLAARHRRHDVVGMHRGRGEAHVLAHQPRRFRAHALDVEQAPAGVRLAAHEHVAPDRLLLAQRPFLVDRLDAEAARARHRPIVDALAVEIDLAAGVGLVETHHELDQRRLARAVVAEQADDLAAIDLEVDARQRSHFAESLRDVAQFDDRRFASVRRRGLRQSRLHTCKFAGPVERPRED